MEESITLFVLGLAIFLITIRTKHSIFSPISLYAMGQLFTLAIAYLKIDSRMTDFSPITWMVWIGSFISFVVGALVASLRKSPPPLSPARVSESPRAFFWAFGIALIYVFGVALGYVKMGGWPLFSPHPEQARMDFALVPFPLGLFQSFNWILLASLPLFIARSKGAKRWTFIVFFALGFSYGILTGFRLVMMFGLFSALATRDLIVRRIPLIKLSAIFAIFIVFSSAILLIRGGIGKEHKALGAGAAILMADGAYVYVANNYWNLNYAVNKQMGDNPHPTTYGGLFFEAPLMIFSEMSRVEESLDWDTWKNEKSISHPPLNTISYQWFLMKEASWLGVILLPGLLGGFAMRLYLQIQRFGSDWATLLYMPIGFSIFFSFFLYMYQTPMYWFIWTGYLLLWVMTKNIKGREMGAR